MMDFEPPYSQQTITEVIQILTGGDTKTWVTGGADIGGIGIGAAIRGSITFILEPQEYSSNEQTNGQQATHDVDLMQAAFSKYPWQLELINENTIGIVLNRIPYKLTFVGTPTIGSLNVFVGRSIGLSPLDDHGGEQFHEEYSG